MKTLRKMAEHDLLSLCLGVVLTVSIRNTVMHSVDETNKQIDTYITSNNKMTHERESFQC